MDEQLKKVPNYNPADAAKVLNPGGYPYIVGTRDNVGRVPPYSDLLAGVKPTPKPPPGPQVPSAPPNSDVEVTKAGKTTTNGIYVYQSPDIWKYGQYYIKRVPYPDPQATSLAIVQGSSVYYFTDNIPLPWDGQWQTGSFGQDPAPTVAAKPSAGKSAEKKAEVVAPKEEPKKKKRFFDF
jgi:hypothetical protein